MKIKKSVVVQKLGNINVAYDNDTSTLHELNETGFRILTAIKKGENKTKIADRLSTTYGLSEEDATRDVEEFTLELIKRDLIAGKK